MATTKKFDADKLAELGVSVEVPSIEVIDKQEMVDPIGMSDLARIAAEEAFMHERVRIRIATTTDVNAPPYAQITVNDVNNKVVLPRGTPVMVKRLHVEVLARMRETRFTQPQRNPMDPEGGNYLIPHHGQVYPFEVLEDHNPLGRPWLERLMAEPTY